MARPPLFASRPNFFRPAPTQPLSSSRRIFLDEPTRNVRGPKRARIAAGTGAAPSLSEVVLTTRFDSATDFVVEYADNITKGGLFIRGAFDLPQLSKVRVELVLPGFGRARVSARVVQTVPGVGVGLDLFGAPGEFFDLMHSFVRRLGDRREALIATSVSALVAPLEAAGYRVCYSREVEQLARLSNAASRKPPTAVVVGTGERALVANFVEPKHLLAFEGDFDGLLQNIDSRLRH